MNWFNAKAPVEARTAACNLGNEAAGLSPLVSRFSTVEQVVQATVDHELRNRHGKPLRSRTNLAVRRRLE